MNYVSSVGVFQSDTHDTSIYPYMFHGEVEVFNQVFKFNFGFVAPSIAAHWNHVSQFDVNCKNWTFSQTLFHHTETVGVVWRFLSVAEVHEADSNAIWHYSQYLGSVPLAIKREDGETGHSFNWIYQGIRLDSRRLNRYHQFLKHLSEVGILNIEVVWRFREADRNLKRLVRQGF